MNTIQPTTEKITTGNKAWGFYNTLQATLNLNEAETADAFDRAARFTAKRLDLELPAARRLLDSRLGRHLADQFHTVKSVEAKLDALYGSWRREVRVFRAAAINSTDEAFYS